MPSAEGGVTVGGSSAVLNIPKTLKEFDETGRMRSSPLCDRIVDVMEELVKFTLLTRDRKAYLVDRYSERQETVAALMKRVNLSSAT
jgi:arsenic resistance protein ArsH